ncbi:MAG: nucleoside-diphosphate sugar epimerase/dehydratase, partial [Georgfuchsia sp.]
IDDLREVGIEDLLGRDSVPADPNLLQKNITGKSILVTGAGGSIGSELCRQILSLQPKRLVLYERNEFSLYSIENELLSLFQNNGNRYHPELIPILGSITDQTRLERVLTRFKIQTVFHAAAYKHVPMVEKNPTEGAYNNIIGTWRAAQAALASGVEAFVLISTDKAVRPTNTMGTTKRFAELILQALAASYPDQTRFTMVRFGNVLGSSGSVVPLFHEQIRQGGPITVTDPRIIRYFMTIPEAAQLVIQAGAMGKDGDVFVLDMGEPVKILDLAKRMIHLSGLSIKDENNPGGDIEIVFSGLRPGEKMYEELLIGDNVVETTHPRIMRANEESLSLESVQHFIGRFDDILQRNATDELRAVLMECVKDFAPQCGNEDQLAPGSA